MASERELKFSLLEERFPSAEDLRLVLEPAAYVLSSDDTQQQHDRYYDDVKRSLRARGLALRRRTVAGKRLATLKRQGRVSGSLHEREEIEVPLTGGEWPGPINRRVSLVIDPASLRSVIDINTHRMSYSVSKGGEVLAILAFDEVSAGYPGSQQSVHFVEAELEAVGGTAASELEVIADLIDRVVRLTPNAVNKLERAEALLSLGAGFQDD